MDSHVHLVYKVDMNKCSFSVKKKSWFYGKYKILAHVVKAFIDIQFSWFLLYMIHMKKWWILQLYECPNTL